MTGTVHLFRPGLLGYRDAWDWQRNAALDLRQGSGLERLALLRHPPVYTLGRRFRPQHLLEAPEALRTRGAEIIETDRGGDITFHGPGQLIAYPILDLRARDLLPGDYVRRLEQTIIEALAPFGITGERVLGRPGVWAVGGKIAAIGVRVQRGVSTHGFALNIDPDLGWFGTIVPCGMPDAGVTSMAAVLGFSPGYAEVEQAVAGAFMGVFDCELESDRAGLSLGVRKAGESPEQAGSACASYPDNGSGGIPRFARKDRSYATAPMPGARACPSPKLTAVSCSGGPVGH